MFDEQKIRKLLKNYGASEKEIENFINDLKEEVSEAVQEKIKEFDETTDDDFIVD